MVELWVRMVAAAVEQRIAAEGRVALERRVAVERGVVGDWVGIAIAGKMVGEAAAAAVEARVGVVVVAEIAVAVESAATAMVSS